MSELELVKKNNCQLNFVIIFEKYLFEYCIFYLFWLSFTSFFKYFKENSNNMNYISHFSYLQDTNSSGSLWLTLRLWCELESFAGRLWYLARVETPLRALDHTLHLIWEQNWYVHYYRWGHRCNRGPTEVHHRCCPDMIQIYIATRSILITLSLWLTF